jgi:hypothetical protein
MDYDQFDIRGVKTGLQNLPAHGRIWSAWCKMRQEVSFINPKREFRMNGGKVHIAEER